MPTVKIVFEKDTAYNGPKERGQVQIALSELAEKIIAGNINITPEPTRKERTVTFRLPQEKLNQLKEIAESNNISVQSLLRTGMGQNNLLVHLN